LGDQFILPSIIDKEVLKKLLKEAELVSKGTLFNLNESECVIGYLDNKESDSFQFKNILECNSSNSTGTSDILFKKKLHKCTYAVRSATQEILNVETFSEAQNLVKTGIEEAIAVCCLQQNTSPIPYMVIAGGPFAVTTRSSSRSSDVLSFGPLITSLHYDVDYGIRTSSIPSWNVGVKKLWFIRRTATVKTQKLVNPTIHKLTAQQQLQTIYNERADYYLLVQEPGDIIKHRGKHYHFVITVYDQSLNPSGLCLSVGKIDVYLEEKIKYVRIVRPVLVKADGSLKPTSREKFMKNQLGSKLSAPVLKELEENKKKRKASKKLRGFSKGNKLACKEISTLLL